MNITHNGDWTTYSGYRWELEEIFPWFSGSASPDFYCDFEFCTLDIFKGTE